MNRIYIGPGISFLFFAGAAAIGQRYFNFTGQTWYYFMTLMGTLGLTTAALYYVLQEKFQNRGAKAQALAEAAGMPGGGAAAAGGEPVGDAPQWVKEANARLGQSRPGVGIENLPMIFVVGDRGTAKTSTIISSGMEAELLTGQVYQDNAIVPTRGANIFFARETVFVEAGGGLMANPASWKALVEKLRPGRLKALGKNTQAPRGVLLCFDLEAFARPGAAEQIVAAARYLHERLDEISQVLGVSFPVYVLFSRADRLPYFSDFVGNLTLEEAGQVVGATLPLRIQGGVYGEGETQRLTNVFNWIFYSFCDQRLRLLPRETDAAKIPGTYEFPREFRKVRNMLVQFLVDIGRPSQLRASPFLRGFYFSGVRAVVTQDIQAPAPMMQEAQQQPQDFGGATRMFRAGFQAEKRAEQIHASAASSGGRKVPQWLFLGHLFHDVILGDAVARAASGSSIKTSMVRRILIGLAASLFLIYSGLLTMSYFGNRSLEQQAITAARNIGAAEGSGTAIPTEDALSRLEVLRESLETLTDYEKNGAPLRLRWGLYSGSAMLPQVRRVYYIKFRQLLFGTTQDGLLSLLQRAPPVPGPDDNYGYAYDTLKAYLLTTSEWKRSSDTGLQTFLGQTLLSHWSEKKQEQIGKSRMDLAKLQFDFYGGDLHNGNPYTAEGDAPAVDRERVYLSKFGGIERVYRFLLSEAARGNPPMTFNGKFPGSSQAVISNIEVAWAYTRDGWAFVKDQIKKANFGGEAWVLGPYIGQAPDKATMEKGILELYTKDYVEQWRKVLKGSNVSAYANWADASKKLTILVGPSAPLLALFWWTSLHTSIDLPNVADKFKAVQVVSPNPQQNNQQFILPSNLNYNNGLLSLQQTVERAANKEPNAEQAVRDSAQAATLNTRQLASGFPNDQEAHIDQRSLDLLLQPIKYLDGLAGGDLRSGGAAFCVAFTGLTSKFPFVPTAVPEVTIQELADILAPPQGKLWQFYNNTLKTIMPCPNGQCTPSGQPPLNPAFVRFISQLMQFSKALYGEAATEPNYQYSLSPRPSEVVDQFLVTINGDPATLRSPQAKNYVWNGSAGSNFRLGLRLKTGGAPIEEEPRNGPWSVFRFFAQADSIVQSGTGYVFHQAMKGSGGRIVQVEGKPLVYDIFVDTHGGPAVFSKEFLSTLRCVGPLAR